MKSLVLTFDDGPDIRYTPVLLDLLKHENIPATFLSSEIMPGTIRS